MSSSVAVKSVRKIRRPIAVIKDEWIRCANVLDHLEKRHGGDIARLTAKHDRLQAELRRVCREIPKANKGGRHDEAAQKVQRAKVLREIEIPEALRRLAVKSHEIDQAKADKLELEIEMAVRTGVPQEYHGDIKIVMEHNGYFSVYFGGIGRPDGPGHAHYAYNGNCESTYRREPTRHKPAPVWRRS